MCVAAFNTVEVVKSCPDASFSRKLNEPLIGVVVPFMKDASVVPYTIGLVDANVIDGNCFKTCNELVAEADV